MTAKEINCVYCGLKGDVDVYDQDMNDLQAKVFKHQGHNPFTGQLYYKCPSCQTTLQVNPMDVLKGEVLKGIPVGEGQRASSLQAICAHFCQKLSNLRKIFQHVTSSSREGLLNANMMHGRDTDVSAGRF